MKKAVLWGELKDEDEMVHVPDVTAEIERSMGKYFLDDVTDDEESSKRVIQKITLPPMDPMVIYAIELHKYAASMTQNINLCKLNQSGPSEEVQNQIPEMPKLERKCKPNSLNYLPKEITDFSGGDELAIVDLKKSVVLQILKKAIAVLFLHIGYETCEQSTLDVLTDVVEDFFRMIIRSFIVANEDETVRQLDGFPHVIERVLTELGLGGVKGITDYYQNRVLKYADVMRERCKDLNEQYKNVAIPKLPSPLNEVNNSVVRVKVEEDNVVEVDNHEVHLADIEGDVSFSILETGYQLLNSLEAQQQ